MGRNERLMAPISKHTDNESTSCNDSSVEISVEFRLVDLIEARLLREKRQPSILGGRVRQGSASGGIPEARVRSVSTVSRNNS